uniref:Helicase C-terminal domain-containing protein n=1 Tax=Arion vulgaris TaxID=1028688 RepID=A0A0B7AZ96_9EUPU
MKDLLKHSYTCLSLHGGIDQYDRDSIIHDFKSGTIKLLVATSVAARGLDVKQLILVVNFDCPNHYEDYVHRCGRTGRAGNKGFAYTFITTEQGRYATDIVRALELSGSPVPADLQNLLDTYREEAKASGKVVKRSSGFSGKGFKFDETEAQLADERKKLQKAALGLHDSDDEDGGAMSIDQKIEDMFASRKHVTDVAKPIINQAPGVVPQNLGSSQTNQQKLELARKLAARINHQKHLGPDAQDISQQAAIAIMKGDSVVVPQVASKTIAEQLAEKLNARLGYRPQSEEEQVVMEPTAGETFKRYEEELDINDFPQTARWKVTSREALATISDFSEAGITVRGSYFPSGKEPKEGERKLYLAIEATSELAISKAKAEIIRLIKEELIRLQNSYQPINRGRYKVL